MTLRNAFDDLALDTSVQEVKDAIDLTTEAVDAAVAEAESTTAAVELASEQVVLLRRLIKLLESQAVVDNQLRQRITIDAFTAGVALPGITTVNTVSTLATATNLNQFAGVDLRFQWAENARSSYNSGVRARLQ